MLTIPAFAQAPGGIEQMLVPLALMLPIFYFLVIRPQQQRAKGHKEMVEKVRRGDTVVLGNGFIVTAMIWATWLVWIIDRRLIAAAWLSLIAAALTLVGLIHSPFSDGRLFVPDGSTPKLVFALAAGYVLLGALCAALQFSPKKAAATDDASIAT